MSSPFPLTVTVLGSGTSAGVPMIGCHCHVCESPDPRDRRTRPSIAISYDDHCVLVDTSPELRLQSRATRLDKIDAVVFTHAHADHIFGLDDVRRYNTILGGPLPVYGAPSALATIQTAFGYAFHKVTNPPADLYRPELVPTPIDGPLELFGRTWQPIPLPHGRHQVLGFRIGDFAYCTDCSDVPASARAHLRGLDTLIIGALRPRPHPAHLSFEQALEVIADLQPRQAYFTHLTHDVRHTDIDQNLPPHVRASYDGMVLEIK